MSSRAPINVVAFEPSISDRCDLRVLMVDPSLFTPPYDAALTAGLSTVGVRAIWAVRPLREGEAGMLPPSVVRPIFYRRSPGTAKGQGAVRKIRKAISHLLGAITLLRLSRSGLFEVVHYQWTVAPLVDVVIMRLIKRRVPVVLTVHDSNPFNGNPTSRWQMLGFDSVLRTASRIVVHTPAARQGLIAKGFDATTIVHIPHGPLSIPGTDHIGHSMPNKRPWVFVLFGKIQLYKGLDVLVEAFGRLSIETRAECRVVVAGEAQMSLDPIHLRIAELGLGNVFEFQEGRLSEPDMAALFSKADCFVFPYRSIEASGVLFLVYGLKKWIVASDLGSFRDLVVENATGALVTPGDPDALAVALKAAIGSVPDDRGDRRLLDWPEIGVSTRELYEAALAELHGRHQPDATMSDSSASPSATR